MIEAEVRQVCRQAGYGGGLSVTVWVPQGRELAEKTFNPHLGIEGGISILGTSGIVEPKSMQALRSPSGWKSGSWPQTEPNSCF